MSKIVPPLRDCEKLGLEPSCMPYSIYYIMYRAFIISLFSKTVRQEAWEKSSKPFADLIWLRLSLSKPFKPWKRK